MEVKSIEDRSTVARRGATVEKARGEGEHEGEVRNRRDIDLSIDYRVHSGPLINENIRFFQY